MATLLTNDNVRLHYELEGDVDGPVLLFSNSLGIDLHMWEGQVEAFRDHYHILRYDSRGHGESEAPPGPYSIERLGRDVLAILDALELDRVSFCGLSMGGMVGMWLGVEAPERFRKIALCNTSAHMPPPKAWTERCQLARNGRMVDFVEMVIERWFTASFRERDPEAVNRCRERFLATPTEGYAACCEAIRDMDQRVTICQIETPTLVISGGKDEATPPENGRFIADRIPNARYVELPDAAHLSNIEQTKIFNTALGNFLKNERKRL